MYEKSLNKIAYFIHKFAPQYTDREKLKEYILNHFEYKTDFVGEENGEITFVCRWNIEDEGREAVILDLILREDYRKMDFMRQILLRGLWLFPTVERISFERGYKTSLLANKGKRVYSVEQFLRHKV